MNLSIPLIFLKHAFNLVIKKNRNFNFANKKNITLNDLEGIIKLYLIGGLIMAQSSNPIHRIITEITTIESQNPKMISIYSKKIYRFVASESNQLLEMLNAKRIDYYATFNEPNDIKYNIRLISEHNKHKDKIHENQFIEIPIIENTSFYHKLIACTNHPLNNKVIKIVNSFIKKNRTNKIFWDKIMKKHMMSVFNEYNGIESIDYLKLNFSDKKKIDSGVYDILYQ